MAMRIRLAAAEAGRKGLHYVASTCCYGAWASSPQPPGPPCMAASLPGPHPALILTGLGRGAEPSAGLAALCPTVDVLSPALCLLLPRTHLRVTPNLAAFLSRTPVQCGDGVMLAAGGSRATMVCSTPRNHWEALGQAAAASHGWGWAQQVGSRHSTRREVILSSDPLTRLKPPIPGGGRSCDSRSPTPTHAQAEKQLYKSGDPF